MVPRQHPPYALVSGIWSDIKPCVLDSEERHLSKNSDPFQRRRFSFVVYFSCLFVLFSTNFVLFRDPRVLRYVPPAACRV